MRNCATDMGLGCWFRLTVIACLLAMGCGQSGSPGPAAQNLASAPPPPPPPTTVAAQEAPPSPVGAPASAPADAVVEVGANPAAPTGDAPVGEASPPTANQQPAGEETANAPSEAELREAAEQTGNGNGAGGNTPHPYQRRIEIPEFSKDITWLNAQPLTKQDLKGKFVLLDFWTYCCINCMHILPELKKLEQQFPNNLVVIGVHSAKFETEKVTDNIREAILRYEIEHPVINDADHSMWYAYGVSSWPTIALIDPEGNFVGRNAGEFKAEAVSAEINRAMPYYRERKLLDEKPLKFKLEVFAEQPTPLRYPGKILADEKGNRLFISDSNHNRIVVATLDGKLIETIGSGAIGKSDGDFQTATFNHPQGCALAGDALYVADTENHMLRKVDLQAKTVKTIAGTGQQASNPWPGWVQGAPAVRKRFVGPPATTELNSPWALWVQKTDLFIAMAGCHQIWRMPLDESEIGPHAGNAREDIVNGPLLPREPFQGGSAVFAQPSGLSSDGSVLYVADSEGSSIRKVPFKHGTAEVGTVVGSDHLAAGARLFAAGDRDGTRAEAKLQHCLDVDFLDGKLYVADTYNHKIKVVTKTGDTKTLVGNGQPGAADSPAQFHEPAGLTHAHGKLYVADTNNHLIRTIDLATGKVATLTIVGLSAPAKNAAAAQAAPNGEAAVAAAVLPQRPDFSGAHEEAFAPASVKATDEVVKLRVSLKIPRGWKINPDGPMAYWLDSPRVSGPVDRAAFGRTKLRPTTEFDVPVRVTGVGDDQLRVSLNYYYCQDKANGICKVGAVVMNVPLTVAASGSTDPVMLVHSIPE